MREINIVGMGPSALSLQDQKLNGEIWGINYSYLYTPLDRLFIAHKFNEFMECSKRPGRRGDNWLSAVLDNRVKEIYSYLPLDIALKTETFPPIPGTDLEVKFTHETGGFNEQELQGCHRLLTAKQINTTAIIRKMQVDNITCTLPYLIGHAIIEKVDRINLFGVEIWAWGGDNKYGGQIPSVNAALRCAAANGIQILFPWVEAMKITDKLFTKGDKHSGYW